ncbi:hypothetical protein JG687_00004832 [Phytophthora cactorum]|uniref:Uncharacterized protein n=1 Tax=Phytophthora cactorum TaxID=29920 RepID=A0A329SX77_9STRA|nr:hypothetical protein Pcac1_g8487 [Phytophthora cactorum]KAG2849356.1 hypothetical protein PC111_g112 [Phytophthora cactorum]KAG2849384.1 hypothetical protein PC112_g362 [Phytophthora cactorum]KAG2869475.1 hypothetical protein PC113_g141 [Phytophthora cactorum]KAG2936763.1 hypothetical protein PC114_g119 [Phytophthora cactorum]
MHGIDFKIDKNMASSNEFDTADDSLGTTVLLSEDEGSLSKQVIMNYFTSDGPRTRRLSDCEPVRNILDESSGAEELRQSGERSTKMDEVHDMEANSPEDFQVERVDAPEGLPEERTKGTLDELFTWEIALSVLVVLAALAHCMWIWNLVELSVVGLEFGD